MDDSEISTLVSRLSRPHPSGGVVIERAAILAAGADFTAVMEWITAHAGTSEQAASPARRGGLHGPRSSDDATNPPGRPLRFVLPAGALP